MQFVLVIYDGGSEASVSEEDQKAAYADYAALNKVYAEYFPGDKPARFCIQCGLVRPDFLVEIASIAHIGQR